MLNWHFPTKNCDSGTWWISALRYLPGPCVEYDVSMCNTFLVASVVEMKCANFNINTEQWNNIFLKCNVFYNEIYKF
jgi:hypothetical protein